MTHDPVLHALIDLVQAVEEGNAIDEPAYQNAIKVIRERVAPGGESERSYQMIGHVVKNEYGFVSAHIPNIEDIAVGKTPIFADSTIATGE
jgi:hypothetical protein